MLSTDMSANMIDNEKDVVLAEPVTPVTKEPTDVKHDKIPCCQLYDFIKCKCGDDCKCDDDCKCGDECKCGDDCKCGKPGDECNHCENIACGKGRECTQSKTACVYKYSCGEGECTCMEKSYCADDELCVKNHATFLENVRTMNANITKFFNLYNPDSKIDRQ